MFADSAYLSEENEKHVLETCEGHEYIMLKGKRGTPLSDEDKVTKKLRSRIRCRVEHSVWKNETNEHGFHSFNRIVASLSA